MTCIVDGSLAIDDSFDTRHSSVKPAELQIAAASLSAPPTVLFEMPGVATTTSTSVETAAARDGTEGGRLAFS